MPLHLQVILRVLQDGVYYRVGGSKEEQCDVRIIAATHRDLEKLIEEGKFRQDLYFELNVVPLFVPPLRERRSDIKVLMDYYLKHYNEVLGKQVIDFDPAAKSCLMSYHWPGNVRELQNVIEYAMNMVDSNFITVEHLPHQILSSLSEKPPENRNHAFGKSGGASLQRGGKALWKIGGGSCKLPKPWSEPLHCVQKDQGIWIIKI